MTSNYYNLLQSSFDILRKALPSQLRETRQWLGYRLGELKPTGKRDKFPYYANGKIRSGDQGSEADRKKLVTFDEAAEAALKHRWSGLGLALLPNTPWIALDFDNVNDDLSPVEPWLHNYVELSPSGKGLRVLTKDPAGHLGKGKLIGKAGHIGVEVFAGLGFVTLTGNAISSPSRWKQIPVKTAKALKIICSSTTDKPSTSPPQNLLNFHAHPTLDDAARLLQRIPNTGEGLPWDDYIKLLCSLVHTFTSQEENAGALQLFMDWAKQSSKFNASETKKHWRSFGKRKSGSMYTYGTLVHMALMENNADDNEPADRSKIFNFKPPPEEYAAPDEFEFSGDMTEFFAKKFKPVNWIVEDFLPPGLTLFAAPPKTGKSRLILQLVLCVAAGKPFLGQPVRQGFAAYLALEDAPVQLHKRAVGAINKLGIKLEAGQAYLQTTWAKGLEAVEGARDMLQAQAEVDNPCKLLVIDVLQRIRDGGESRKPQYEVDYESLKPWADLRKEFPDVSIVLVHHTRKMQGDDVFDSISGTQGIAGSVDSMWILFRPKKSVVESCSDPDEVKDKLAFYIRGRMMEQGDVELVLQSEQDMFTLTDLKPWEIADAPKQVRLLQLITSDSEKEWTSTELHDALADGSKISSTRNILWRMSKKGLIIGDNGVGYSIPREGKY